MSPKSKEQFAAIRERSVSAIKSVALELFARNGYQSTSVSQIAELAGISKGLLYNYFDGKEALLHNIILEAVESGEEMMRTLFSQVDEPREQLEQLVRASVQMVRSDLHYWKLMTSLAFQTEALSSLEPLLKEKQRNLIAILEKLFNRMSVPDPRREAFLFAATMDGMMLHYLSMPESYPLEDMQAFLLARYRQLWEKRQNPV